MRKGTSNGRVKLMFGVPYTPGRKASDYPFSYTFQFKVFDKRYRKECYIWRTHESNHEITDAQELTSVSATLREYSWSNYTFLDTGTLMHILVRPLS